MNGSDMEYRFQVNLGGIIDLLSNHTYSSPQVFIRELLQNCVDAIVARQQMEPGHRGEVSIELPDTGPDSRPMLIFRDNGIGLTEEEVHLFLATIGQTSKRPELFLYPTSFIGQFGVGLLSCFLVSDEVVVVTRSAKAEGRRLEWRGRPDGTYSLKVLEGEAEAGTEVRLRSNADSMAYFTSESVTSLAAHYGSLLPFPIKFSDAYGTVQINGAVPPWEESFDSPELEREAYMGYGRATLGTEFLDYVPLRSFAGEVRGAAFVLPYSPSLSMKKTHRVYLKKMLLSEQTEGLLPDWAFFVKCAVNADALRPTASRESFYEDETLAVTREELGRQLKQYLIDLALENPRRLKKLIGLHHLSLKALAVDDDEFFNLMINWLPFETNMGVMTLTEYLRDEEVVRFTTNKDQFRQTASIAAAQSLCVINASYTYDDRLIEKLARLMPRIWLQKVDGLSLSHVFERLTLDEEELVTEFLETAGEVLAPFNCAPEIRKFSPDELPALYIAGSESQFMRSVESAKEVTDAFWSSLLDEVQAGLGTDEHTRLCFNYRNPVIHKIVKMRDRELLRLSVQMLYVQSILLSHRPLQAKEMALLNEGLLRFIEWGADAQEGWVQ